MNGLRLLALALLALTPGLTAGAALHGSPEGAAPLDEGYAIPLRGETPSEYTPAVHEKVLAAGARGLAYDLVNDREAALAMHHLFIRPGGETWSPSRCTLGFVLGAPGSYKITTAGHCVAVGQDVVMIAYPGVLVNIGRASASRANGIGDDWAIIEIRSTMQAYVDANVACIGGPLGTYAGNGGDILVLKYVGAAMPCVPREGRPTYVGPAHFLCACPIAFGDSGAPVLAVTADNPLGYAFGLMTHLVVGPTGTAAGVRVTMLPYAVRDGDLDPLPPA